MSKQKKTGGDQATLRDVFAAHALAGMLASPLESTHERELREQFGQGANREYAALLAMSSFVYADEMLKAREAQS